jgi:uncharacterized protein (DUF1778 family)
MPAAPRTVRHEARLRPDQKERIEQAARIEGLSLIDFIVQAADEAAGRVVALHSSWTLQEQDHDVFVKAMFNPPEPVPAEMVEAKPITTSWE